MGDRIRMHRPGEIVSTVEVETVGAHERVDVWNRGGKAGTLTVSAGDGEAIAERLAGDRNARSILASVVEVAREGCFGPEFTRSSSMDPNGLPWAPADGDRFCEADCECVICEAERLLEGEPTRAECLKEAIRRLTVDAGDPPGTSPNGPAEAALEALLDEIEAAPIAVFYRAQIEARISAYLEASATDTRELREAAEAYFGGDFGRPS